MLVHLLGPFILYAAAPMPAPARMVEWPGEEIGGITPLLRQRLLDMTERMTAAGFGAPVYAGPAVPSNHDSAAAFFERPDGRALAFVFVTEGPHTPTLVSVTISTRFDDGWMLSTTTFDQVFRFPRRPFTEGLVVTESDDPARLWAIHEFWVSRRKPGARPMRMTRGLDPLGYEYADSHRAYDHWVASGYAYELPNGALKFTALGACLAAWRGVFPWKQWTAWQQRRRTAAVQRDMALYQ